MKLLQKVGAGLLLSVGYMFLMLTLADLVALGTTEEEKEEARDGVLGGLILGVP